MMVVAVCPILYLLYTPRHAQKIIDPTVYILVLAADVCVVAVDDGQGAAHQRIRQSAAERGDYVGGAGHCYQPVRHH